MATKRAKKSTHRAKRVKRVYATPKKKKRAVRRKKDFLDKCLDIFN